MNANEIINKFNRFFLDTPLNTIEIIKNEKEFTSIIKWKIGYENRQESKVNEKDVLPWIERNKGNIQYQ